VHHHEYETRRAASGGTPSHDPSTLEPLALPLARAVLVTGLSRSAIYRAAAADQITLLKVGRSTLVDMASARDFLAGLPRAEVGRRQAGR
jgi:hypothetical protein